MLASNFLSLVPFFFLSPEALVEVWSLQLTPFAVKKLILSPTQIALS